MTDPGRGIGRLAAGLGSRAVDLVFPRRCPVCDRPVRPFGALICTDCETSLRPVGQHTCMRCGKPVDPAREYCADCVSGRHAYDAGAAVYTFRSCSGALYRFKYRHREEYAEPFGRAMADRYLAWSRQGPALVRRRPPQLLVPVPSSPARVRQRGYDQSVLLARVISRQTGIPTAENVLERTVNTALMRGMTVRERQKNTENAFHVKGNSVESKSIMLIDDIYTTGATMDACARALRRAGAGPVYFLTLAIGEQSIC